MFVECPAKKIKDWDYDRFFAMANHFYGAILIVDNNYKITFVNQDFCELVGDCWEHLIGQDFRMFIADASLDFVMNWFIHRKGEEELSSHYDIQVLSKKGEKHPVRLFAKSFRNESGCMETICQLIDCKEKKQNESPFQDLIQHAHEAICVVQDGYLKFYNARIFELSGYSNDESLSTPFSEFIHPEDRDFVVERFIERFEGEDVPQQYSFRIIDKQHQVHWVEVIVMITEWHGNPAALVLINDITESKKAEQALQETQERLKAFMNSASDSFYILDSQLNFVEVNPKALEIIGKEKEAVVGKHITEIVPGIKKSGRYDQHLEVIRTGISFTIEDFIPHPVFGDKHFIMKSFKVGDGLGIIATDITDQKNAETKLQASVKEKSLLLKEIHHRVKNNLQIICSLLNLQSRHINDETTKQNLEESQNRIQSIAMVHDQLYNSDNFSEINLKNYLHDMVQNLQNNFNGKVGQIEMSLDVQEIILGIDVAVPCGLFLNEIITNAFRHAFPKDWKKRKKIDIKIIKRHGNLVKIVVADNGIGLPEDIDCERSNKLGLKLVSIIVEGQLGGTLSVNRNPGTTFTIVFDKKGMYATENTHCGR